MLHFINFNDEKSVLSFLNSLRMILINKKDLEKIEDCYSSGETDGIPSPVLKMIDEEEQLLSKQYSNEQALYELLFKQALRTMPWGKQY